MAFLIDLVENAIIHPLPPSIPTILYAAGATTVVSAELVASIEVTAHLLRMYEVPEDEVERQREMVRSKSCSLPV